MGIWCMAHHWMTFFLVSLAILAINSSVAAIAKAILGAKEIENMDTEADKAK